MAPPPTIFTKTPIEAVIQDMGFEAQAALASTIVGTPAFFGAAATVFMLRVVYLGGWMGVGAMDPKRATYEVLKAWFFLMLGWFLLGYQVVEAPVAAPLEKRDQAWNLLPAVAANQAYERLDANLHRPTWGFHLINTAVEELSAQVYAAVASATEAGDPSEQVYGLMALQATSLGAEHKPLALAWNDLARNCSALEDAKIYERGARAQDLFDMNRPGCSQKWDSFSQEYGTAKDQMVEYWRDNYGNGVLNDPSYNFTLAMDRMEAVFDGQDSFQDWAFGVMMENYITDQAHRAINSRRHTEATFSDGITDSLAEGWMGGPGGEFFLNMVDLLPWIDDPHAAAAKAEAANKFNEYADLIPTLRGFLHAMFAAFYPLVAFAVALGWTRPFIAWLAGRFTLALYTPAATLLYGMTDVVTQQSQLTNNAALHWVGQDEFMLGGVALLEQEVTRIQTSYLMCELAVFTGFLVGSASLLKGGFAASSSVNNHVEQGFRSVQGAFGVASGAKSLAATAVTAGGVAAGWAAAGAGALAGLRRTTSTGAGQGGAGGPRLLTGGGTKLLTGPTGESGGGTRLIGSTGESGGGTRLLTGPTGGSGGGTRLLTGPTGGSDGGTRLLTGPTGRGTRLLTGPTRGPMNPGAGPLR